MDQGASMPKDLRQQDKAMLSVLHIDDRHDEPTQRYTKLTCIFWKYVDTTLYVREGRLVGPIDTTKWSI